MLYIERTHCISLSKQSGSNEATIKPLYKNGLETRIYILIEEAFLYQKHVTLLFLKLFLTLERYLPTKRPSLLEALMPAIRLS